MCLSFTDDPMARQEEVLVSSLAFSHGDRNPSYWTRRVEGFTRWMVEATYPEQTTDVLTAHRATLVKAHADTPDWPHWAAVVELIDAELSSRSRETHGLAA